MASQLVWGSVLKSQVSVIAGVLSSAAGYFITRPPTPGSQNPRVRVMQRRKGLVLSLIKSLCEPRLPPQNTEEGLPWNLNLLP
eukprot:scaffold5628_cov139-Skeletonema_marinoi.AAC.3